MAIDSKKLEKLSKSADVALFDLHDYLRRELGEDNYLWRRIYGIRVDLNQVVFGLRERLKHEAAEIEAGR